MNKTHIEWTDYTSNPLKFRDPDGGSVWGCVKVSAGCTNCYAEALAHRYQGGEFTVKRMATLTPYVDEAELRALLSVRRLPAGSKVFMGDMTDIFGPWVTDGMIYQVWRTMARRPDVTFQLLTKRPERMRDWFTRWADLSGEVNDFKGVRGPEETRKAHPSGRGQIFASWLDELGKATNGEPPPGAAWPTFDWMEGPRWWTTAPLPNVWLGTSVEDQVRANERIGHLLATPAAVRFLSCEPLLGPVDLAHIDTMDPDEDPGFSALVCGPDDEGTIDTVIDWVIVGGESGPGARPCDIGWIRGIVGQCQAAGTAVFVKQLGAKPYRDPEPTGNFRDGPDYPGQRQFEIKATFVKLRSPKGGAIDEWPADLRVREFPS